VDDGDGPDVESENFEWLAPVLTPTEADALTTRAETAEGDAARFERDLTLLHADYDALAANRGELRGGPTYVPALCTAGGDARPCGKPAVALCDGAYYCEEHK